MGGQKVLFSACSRYDNEIGADMSMNTLVEAEIWTVARTDQGNAVLVRPKGADLAVPIFIGQLETQSILIGFGNVDTPRPLSHDLLISVLKGLEAEIDHIEINDLKEGTFYARVIVNKNDKQFVFDSRPSDAIALAVRVKCPVFIAEFIVDEAGISVNLVSDAPGEKKEERKAEENPRRQELLREKEKLMQELSEAVELEDYEKAAVLRDKLKNLDSEFPSS
jgi:uncharacterized protein